MLKILLEVSIFCSKLSYITVILVYVIVWLAVVFGINSASNAGGKIVVVRGEAEHYYSFPAYITRTINSKYYS